LQEEDEAGNRSGQKLSGPSECQADPAASAADKVEREREREGRIVGRPTVLTVVN